MSKVYHILEEKPMVYTYKVYAKSKAEALRKYNSHGDYEEIGLDPGFGKTSTSVVECGEAIDTCAVCGESFSPDNVRDYLCRNCLKGRK